MGISAHGRTRSHTSTTPDLRRKAKLELGDPSYYPQREATPALASAQPYGAEDIVWMFGRTLHVPGGIDGTEKESLSVDNSSELSSIPNNE